jgi:four helix bundle protein
MSKVTRFEELIAWQKGRALASRIYRMANDGAFQRDFAFRNQICKAAISVPSNIAEGFERYTPSEFAYFLKVAKASCGEVRSDVYVAFDVGHIDEATMQGLVAQAGECGRIIGRLRVAVAKRIQKRQPLSTQHPALST